MTNGLTRPLQNQTQNLPRSQSTTPSTARKNAPSPTPQFDARKLRNAKWSSNEEVNKFGSKTSTEKSGRPVFGENGKKDYKPVNFDGNSLHRDRPDTKQFQQPIPTDPNESFAWKDSTLDRKLKELEERAKKQGDVQLDVNGFDKNIDKSIGNWSSLPKAPNSDILLLQKAREEKKS